MRARPELTIITKTYDLILWYVPIVGRFPRAHRYSLGQRIEGTLYSLLESLVRAKYGRGRTDLLDAGNMLLDMLRFQTRLAKDLGLVSVERYEYVARHVDEIGRELGGWLKQQTEGKER